MFSAINKVLNLYQDCLVTYSEMMIGLTSLDIGEAADKRLRAMQAWNRILTGRGRSYEKLPIVSLDQDWS